MTASGTSVAAQAGSVTLQMDGKRRYALYLNNPGQRPATINLRFTASGDVIHEAQLNYGEAKRCCFPGSGLCQAYKIHLPFQH